MSLFWDKRTVTKTKGIVSFKMVIFAKKLVILIPIVIRTFFLQFYRHFLVLFSLRGICIVRNSSCTSYLKKIALLSCPLTLKGLFISESCIEIKIELKFYFHTSLWCLKRFYEGLKAFIKPFEAPQRSVKIKILLNFFTLSGIVTFRVKYLLK